MEGGGGRGSEVGGGKAHAALQGLLPSAPLPLPLDVDDVVAIVARFVADGGLDNGSCNLVMIIATLLLLLLQLLLQLLLLLLLLPLSLGYA